MAPGHWFIPPSADLKRDESFRLPAPHAIVHVQDVSFDLVARSVLRELSHFQHVENRAGIPIAPFNKRGQNRFQIGRPQLDLFGFAPGKF